MIAYPYLLTLNPPLDHSICPLKSNKHLEELDVSRNFIRDVDLWAFQDLIKDNRTLKKIDLRSAVDYLVGSAAHSSLT